MTTVMKTPGVYVVEKSAFPNSVVEVATAVPAFVGYTERAIDQQKSLHNSAWRITSMAEFHQHYGGGPDIKFKLEEKPADSKNQAAVTQDGKEYFLARTNQAYNLTTTA